MKRMMALLLVLCLCVSLCGCSGMDYSKASRLYKKGEYAQALEIFRSLGDYADSRKMAEIAAQKADYAAAESYVAAGEYELAIPLYEGLGMYSDSPLKAVDCRYRQGLKELEAGNYEQAVSWLAGVGNYEDALEKVNEARWLWLGQSRRTHVIEEGDGNFTALSCVSMQYGRLRLHYESRGHLLGLPYETEFFLLLERGEQETGYKATYRTVTDTVVEEAATGQVDLATLEDAPVMTVSNFSQTITHESGKVDTSSNTADAIMIQMIMMEAAMKMPAEMQNLLDKAGINATAADFGL